MKVEVNNVLKTTLHRRAHPIPLARLPRRWALASPPPSLRFRCPTMAMLLVLIPAILMALAIVREKELGSITNFYVTPVTGIEFLLGK